jgi:RNA 2',3'-cyclic 3'-phosphodiesterase
MKRIFIALKVEAEPALLDMRSYLKSGLRTDNIKWTSVGNIHITLAFLGDTHESLINALITMLSEKCRGYGKYSLTLKGCGLFRSFNDPRIIWTGIEPSDRLIQLNESIMDGLKRLNIKMEDRPYNPHLTLGRIKHLNDKDLLKTLIDRFQNTELQIVPVTDVILYESILLQSGPVYKPLAKFSLD